MAVEEFEPGARLGSGWGQSLPRTISHDPYTSGRGTHRYRFELASNLPASKRGRSLGMVRERGIEGQRAWVMRIPQHAHELPLCPPSDPTSRVTFGVESEMIVALK